MKIFSFIGLGAPMLDGAPSVDGDDRLSWLRDPLSHPAVERMSERELADLPFRMTARATPLECCQSA